MLDEDGKTLTSVVEESANQLLVRDGRKAAPADALKIGQKYLQSRIKPTIESRIVDFLRVNKDLLPMFAAPGMPAQNV